jgi:RNA polymerase sigma-70 factor (ECF subfamily)
MSLPRDLPTAEEVFHLYAPRVYRLALRMLGNATDADDVTQQVLVQVVRKLYAFRGESSLSTWLYWVTLNRAFARRRRHAAKRQQHQSCTPSRLGDQNEEPSRLATPTSLLA